MNYIDHDEDDNDEEWLAEVLIDGEWVEFDFCDGARNIQTSYPLGKYLGSSVQTRYDGVLQEDWSKIHHFWLKVK